MKLLSPIDVTVLTWLKPGLDSTLQQARNSFTQDTIAKYNGI